MFQGGLPIRLIQSTCSKNDVVLGLLGSEYESLLVVVELDEAAILA